MRVFLTGATGFIGTETVKELIQAGHQVSGLTRSDEAAEQLKMAGAEVHRGDLADIQNLRTGAEGTDGSGRTIRTRSVWSVFCSLLVFLMLGVAGARAQEFVFPGAAVGVMAAPQMVTVTISKAGAVSAISVRTRGKDGADYTNLGGGTCATTSTYSVGQSCTVNVGYTPLAPGERRGAVTLLDSNNLTLGVEALQAYASGSLLTFIPATISTVAGNTQSTYNGHGAAATAAGIAQPYGIAIDTEGNLYIPDSGNNRIRKVLASTGDISTLAGNGTAGNTGDGGLATAALINDPTSVTLDGAGNVFFTDHGNNAVRRIDAFTGIITTFAGSLTTHGYTGDGGPATSATLNSPNGIIFDADANFYIADTGNNVVRKVAAGSGTITTVAGNGTAYYGGDGGKATDAGLNQPWGEALFANGDLYVADTGNHVIRRIDSGTGVITTVVGNHVQGFSGDGGAALSANLNLPSGVAIDAIGNLYISDTGNNRIRKVIGPLSNASPINTVAGNGSLATTGDGGPATSAGLYAPYGMVFDGLGSVYLADALHNTIRKVTSNQAALQYPKTIIGQTSATQSVIVENDGDADLSITAVQPTQQAVIDPAITTCTTSTSLQKYTQCVVGAKFVPTMTGNPDTGTVTVQNGATNQPGVVSLIGQVVDLNVTTVTLTSSFNPGLSGQSVTFLANVTSVGTPTGTVNFFDGTTKLGTATLQPSGYAAFTTATLAVGSHPITAAYTGDSINAAATSPVLTQVVQLSGAPGPPGATFTLTASPTTLNLRGGLHTLVTLNLKSATPFADTVLLGCAGLPLYSSCTFTTNQVALAEGGATTVTMNLDTGNPSGFGALARADYPPLTSRRGMLVFGMLPILIGLGGLRFRRRIRLLVVLGMIAGLVTLSGCGSGLNFVATAPGNYTFQVVGSGIKTGAKQAAFVQLTVTK